MFTSNPFAELSASLPAAVMQTYVVAMIVLVVAGTLIDVVHKGSAKYFFENWRKSKSKGSKRVGGGELVSIAIKTGVVDVLASGEFCNARRRFAHLLTMYGFVIYVVTTASWCSATRPRDAKTPAHPASKLGLGAMRSAWRYGLVSSGLMSSPRATRRCASCARICSSSRFSPA